MRYKIARKSLAIPFVLFLVLFVLIPILFIVYYAFTDADGYFTFDAFVSFFTSATKLNVLLISLLIGLLNTVLCLLIGFPLAYLLSNPKINKNYMLVMLFVMPMWINFVLRTGALRDLLSLILTSMGTSTGKHPLFCTMVGMVINYIPFTILPLYSTLLKLDKSQIEAARDLGCNNFQTFTKAIIPQAMPGIIFGNSIYLSFSSSNWNDGSFMSLIMLVIIFVVMCATKKFQGNDSEKGGASW